MLVSNEAFTVLQFVALIIRAVLPNQGERENGKIPQINPSEILRIP